MPFQIIRQDITKIDCDAIVNPTSASLLHDGGIDAKIHAAAGARLEKALEKIATLNVGEAVVTPAFDLACKYIIHTAGPIWQDGAGDEQRLLESCYKSVLRAALENECESIAIPLISTGAYNFPRDKALRIAVNMVSEFLLENEMQIFIVVYDKESYKFSKKLFDEVQEYIDDNYIDEEGGPIRRVRFSSIYADAVSDSSPASNCQEIGSDLEQMLSEMDDPFSLTLLKLIDIKQMSDVECYKRANVSKQTWYKIMNDKDYKPSKNTVIAFAISLKLTIEQARQLLATVGFTLSRSSKFDIIIEYFISNGKYDIFEINETLFAFDLNGLGV